MSESVTGNQHCVPGVTPRTISQPPFFTSLQLRKPRQPPRGWDCGFHKGKRMAMGLTFRVPFILSQPSNYFMEGQTRPETCEQRASQMGMSLFLLGSPAFGLYFRTSRPAPPESDSHLIS